MLKKLIVSAALLALVPSAFAASRSFDCEAGVYVTVFNAKRIKVEVSNVASFLARAGKNEHGTTYSNDSVSVYVPKHCMENATATCQLYIDLDPANGSTPYQCKVVR